MRILPPPGRTGIAEWTGLRVRSLRPLRNGYAELPAGTEYVVGHAGLSGLHLASAKCMSCGAIQRVSGVSHEDVEVIESPAAAQLGIPGLEPPDAKPLFELIEEHCADLDRTADVLMAQSPSGSFAATAAEIRVAARELRTALAAELASRPQPAKARA